MRSQFCTCHGLCKIVASLVLQNRDCMNIFVFCIYTRFGICAHNLSVRFLSGYWLVSLQQCQFPRKSAPWTYCKNVSLCIFSSAVIVLFSDKIDIYFNILISLHLIILDPHSQIINVYFICNLYFWQIFAILFGKYTVFLDSNLIFMCWQSIPNSMTSYF